MTAGRVALVTGANTGIGRAIAARLVHDGLTVAAHSRDAGDVPEEIGAATWVFGDLLDAQLPEQLVAQTLDRLGALDVLVNNAGLTLARPAEELSSDDFDSIFGVDVRGAFLLAREALAPMRAAGGGSIVNITSVHEHVPRPGLALYAAAKAALGMLTKGLALEWARHGIRVNSVAPGAIATERNREADSLAPEVPLGRAGTPDEVAALTAWLVSDEARYVTGASYLIDGGMAIQVVDLAAS